MLSTFSGGEQQDFAYWLVNKAIWRTTMNPRSSKTQNLGICLLIVSATAFLLQPSLVLAAKTLASEALASAIESGTLDQIRQEMLMDLYQKQKYEFDEQGIEDLGKKLLDQGEEKGAIEVLQLNQMIHGQSPGAANALADAYRHSDKPMMARMYYDTALNLDSKNQHARQALEALDGEGDDSGIDTENMQAAMAQMGMEMTPEQQQQMQEGMAELQKYQEDPGSYQAPEGQTKKSSAAAEPRYESEFCEVLNRFSAAKKIMDSQIRARVEGNYGEPGDTMRTWNVETACGDFLIAVPLWADVSPPVMTPTSGNSFEDAMGGRWDFQMDGETAVSVTYTPSDGTISEMNRLGDPVSFD